MRNKIIHEVYFLMNNYLSDEQNFLLESTLRNTLGHYSFSLLEATTTDTTLKNQQLIDTFIAAKKLKDVLKTL